MWRGHALGAIRNTKGFTLLSVMIALSVLCFVASLITLFTTVAFRQSANDTVGRKDIWLFLHQAEIELAGSSRIQCQADQLSFQVGGNEMIYQMNGQNLRRRVNNSGNEIIIRSLQNFHCEKNDALISIEILDLKGKMYRWTVQNMIE